MKILNAYAGLGGNRTKWKNVKVTAVERDPKIAKVYQDRFPNDKVIVADAHQYILDHYFEFDFIWVSRPCQSHSSFRHNICVRYRGTKPVYPDFGLYEEIVFLKHHFKGYWVAENVKPYYKPLISGKLIQRHMFWSNFDIPDFKIKHENLRSVQIPQLQKLHGIDLSDYKIKNKRQLLRNCVDADLGLHVFTAFHKGGKEQ